MIPSTSPWTPARDALLTAIIAANPPITIVENGVTKCKTITNEALAGALSSATGTAFTESQVCHRRKSIQIPTIAVSNDRLPLHGIVDFAEAVERRGASSAPDGFTRVSVDIMEAETDETSSRRVSTRYIAPKFALAPVPSYGPLTYWRSADVIEAPAIGDPLYVLTCGDTQGVHLDPIAWALFLIRVRSRRWDEIVFNGDLLDLPQLSKFAPNAKMDVLLSTEFRFRAYRLREVREAAGPDTIIKWVPGNHEERLERWLGANAPQFALLTRLGDSQPVLSIEHLLRLDELGITYLRDQHGLGWPQACAIIKTRLGVPVLKIIHGDCVKQGAGASAIAEIAKHNCNVVMGHVHRAATVFKTRHLIDGTQQTFFASETGCMCRIDSASLGYGLNPDWQQSFGEYAIYDDGTVIPTIVQIIGNRAYAGPETWAVENVPAFGGEEEVAA